MKLSRRAFLGAAALDATMGLAPRLAFASVPQRPPNIILMLGDDHRADALGCAGNPVVQTPELDRLAREGVHFQNHFCTTPICCVSRASIILGQYASTHGINDFTASLSPEQLQRSYFTLLRQAGYHTGFIGKFGVGDNLPDKSFDIWNGFPGQGSYYPQGEPGPHLANIMRDQAVDFLRTAPMDKPFCLSISFKAPHEEDLDPRQFLPSPETFSLYRDTRIPPPAGAGPDDIGRFPLAIQHSESRRRWGVRFSTPALYQDSMKNYYRLVSGNDMTVGAIRKALAERGLADNTIVIYSADHGVFNAEHGLAGKWYPHEESIRIPLIVYDPRLPAGARGKRCQAATLNLDLYPSVLEMAGVSLPPGTEARSIVPHLMQADAEARRIFFIEHHFPYGGFIPSSEAIRTGRWKYIRYTDNAAPFEEMYDLAHDPHETGNLAQDTRHAPTLDTLRSYCATWKQSFAIPRQSWSDPVTEARMRQDRIT
jgi:arylsulfatase A-like enzyme